MECLARDITKTVIFWLYFQKKLFCSVMQPYAIRLLDDNATGESGY